MALRLKIVSDNAAAAGEHSRWTFGVNGGRIGRHTSNDWVLGIPSVTSPAGTPKSSIAAAPGTCATPAPTALSSTIPTRPSVPIVPHPLVTGDRFRIGEYEIEVEISGGNDFLPQESAPISDADLDASFEVKSFISTGRREREAQARPRNEAARAACRAARRRLRPSCRPPHRPHPRARAKTRICGRDSSRSARAPASIRWPCPRKSAPPRCSRPGSCCGRRLWASRSLRGRAPTSPASSEFHRARAGGMRRVRSCRSRPSNRSWN